LFASYLVCFHDGEKDTSTSDKNLTDKIEQVKDCLNDQRTLGLSPIVLLQTIPRLARNDVKSTANLQRAGGTLHFSDQQALRGVNAGPPGRRDRGNL
jgi:hypothetical protein